MAWGYNRFSKPKIIPAKVVDTTIPTRLDAVINNPAVSAGDKQFCESLKAGWVKYNSLTAGQYGAFQKCEMRYDATAMAANALDKQKRDEWVANFDNEKRTILNICANYYSKTNYFKDIADKVLADQNFIPSEKQYNAMCKNKYAQRLLENTKIAAKYEVGSLVVIRETAIRRRYPYNSDNNNNNSIPYVILSASDEVGPSAGSRKYSLLQIGSNEKVTLEEKELKPFREGKHILPEKREETTYPF